MARFNADGSPSGRPRYDEEGNPFTLTGQDLLDSNLELEQRYGLPPQSGAGLVQEESNERRSGGYGKKRVGEQSRKQMNLTSGSNRSSILTS